jgi:hypothetical protein
MLERNQWKFLARLSLFLSTKVKPGRLRFVRGPFAFVRVRCLLGLCLPVGPSVFRYPEDLEFQPRRRQTGSRHVIFRTRLPRPGKKRQTGRQNPPLSGLTASPLAPPPPSTSATSVVSPLAYPSAVTGRDQRRGPEQQRLPACLGVVDRYLLLPWPGGRHGIGPYHIADKSQPRRPVATCPGSGVERPRRPYVVGRIPFTGAT